MRRPFSLLLGIALVLGCRRAPRIDADPARADVAPTPPEVRIVADAQDRPFGLLVDATHVYWTNQGSGKSDGSLSRVEKKPGAKPELLASGLGAPYGIAVAGERVYWAASRRGHDGLGWVSLSDPAREKRSVRLAGEIESPWTLVARGDRLFFADLHLRRIGSFRVDAPGYKIVGIANTDGQPAGLAADDTSVYWSDSDPGVVSMAPLEGGAITTLVARGDKTTGLAIDDAHVYWSEWGSGRIGRVKKGGGGLTPLTNDQKGVRAIAVDDARIYWTHPPSHSIRSMPKTGGAFVTHATEQKNPYAIAVDETSIYWTDVDGGAVRAVDKRVP